MSNRISNLSLKGHIQISYFNFKLRGNALLLAFTVFLGHFRLHKCQRSCPKKLVNAKSKNHFERTNGQTDGRTDGMTWSLLDLLIAANKKLK